MVSEEVRAILKSSSGAACHSHEASCAPALPSLQAALEALTEAPPDRSFVKQEK